MSIVPISVSACATRRLDAVEVGDVQRHDVGIAAFGLDLGAQALQPLDAAAGERDAGACLASTRANCAPRPLDAPVTRATRPERSMLVAHEVSRTARSAAVESTRECRRAPAPTRYSETAMTPEEILAQLRAARGDGVRRGDRRRRPSRPGDRDPPEAARRRALARRSRWSSSRRAPSRARTSSRARSWTRARSTN